LFILSTLPLFILWTLPLFILWTSIILYMMTDYSSMKKAEWMWLKYLCSICNHEFCVNILSFCAGFCSFFLSILNLKQVRGMVHVAVFNFKKKGV
jgi:hypothetical protein